MERSLALSPRSTWRRNQDTLHAIFENTQDAILLADDGGRYVDANPAACELFGVPFEDLIGKQPSDFVDSRDFQRIKEDWNRFRGESAQRGRFFLKRPNGTTRILDYSAKTNFLPGYHLSILRDVSEQFRLEQQNWEAQIQIQNLIKDLELMTRAIPQMIWKADLSGNIVFVNFRWMEYFGVDSPKGQKLPFEGLIHPEDHGRLWLEWERSRSRLEKFEVECRFKRNDGMFRWQLVHSLPCLDPDRQSGYWLGTFTDIQTQKQAIEDRDRFISMSGHELRSPLSTANLQLHVLETTLVRTRTNENEVGLVKKIQRQINRVHRILEDMLDISRIQDQKLELHKEYGNLTELILEIIENMKTEAVEPPLIHLLNPKPIHFFFDPQRVMQILTNLLSNAIKYGEGKSVLVSMEETDTFVEIQVQDQGIGISPPYLKKLFQPYERGGAPSKTIGMGLGLYISRKLVEAHGGDILVTSEVGRGSIFTVRLPKSSSGLL